MANLQDFNKAKRELAKEEMVNSIYSNQKSVMTGVTSIIPFLGPFIDKLADQKFESYQLKKRKLFIDTVLSNEDLITSDKVSNVQFIINNENIIKLVDTCTSNDKVIYYGNLIRNGYFQSERQISNDDFEEYRTLLSDLSEREIKYLIIFANHARENGYCLEGKALNLYFKEMKELYPNISPIVMLNRLKRTGFINDEAAWADYGDADETVENADANLVLGSGNAFTLDHGYDDFERMVLEAFDSGKSI